MSPKDTKRRPVEPFSYPPPIAVISIESIFPGSTHIAGFWRDICAGKDLITDVPPSHWLIDDYYDPDPNTPDKTYTYRGAFLPPVDFNPMEFGMPPNNIPLTDTAQLLALVVAKRVLEEATKGRLKELDRDRISVILGVAVGTALLTELNSRIQRPVWLNALRKKGVPENEAQAICDDIASHYTPWKEASFPGCLCNVIAGRIANRFDLGGTNCTVDAACASTLSALSMAVNELYLGQTDLVITGGVDASNEPFMFVSFSKTPALSPTHDTRPFSDKADGMMLGEGIGMYALKRLDDAERDGDQIYAVIKGLGSSSDGAGTSIYAPVPTGQAKALRKCYRAAGFSPATVELVEAHGTGTMAGDVAEFQGLSMVFDDAGRKDRQWCALGSVKSQMGHAKSSAAAAGFVKTVMALHHKVLPPTIKVERPDPRLHIDKSCFYLNTTSRPWIRGSAHPRRAGISSFGFGGTNFHVTLEEYTKADHKPHRLRTLPTELILLSAESEANLATLCRENAEGINDTEGVLIYLAKTSQNDFDPARPHRLAIVASDEKDLKDKLEKAAKALSQKPEAAPSFPKGVYYHTGEAEKAAALAFVFPGQGSQYVGMGADLAMYFDDARQIWDMAADMKMDEALHLHDVVFPIPVFSKEAAQKQTTRLTNTQWAQPAITATSLSMLALLKSLGLKPACVGGHSLGEVTALYEAGVLDRENVLKVARKRGELMAKAAASIPGSMTAVAQPIDVIKPLLDSWKSEVIIANHNSPSQVVLSGPTPAIEDVEKRLTGEKMKTIRLKVSTPFHSPLMKPSCDPFLEFLNEVPFSSPSVPVYANAEAAPYPEGEKEIRALLTRQIASSVRFVEQIEAMHKAGARIFIEVGPNSVLTRLIRQCLKDKPHTAINLDTQGENGVTSLWHALGQLAARGTVINFAPLWQNYTAPAVDPRDVKKPPLTVSLRSNNYQRPYPPPEGAAGLAKPNPPRGKTLEKEPDKPVQSAPIPPEEPAPSKATRPTPQPSKPSKPAPATQPPPSRPAAVAPEKTAQIQQPPAAPVMPAPPGQPAGTHDDGWIAAYQAIQRQTAETHAAYQKTMTESHLAFLKAVESAAATLNNMISGQQPLPAESVPQAVATPSPASLQPPPPLPVTTPPATSPQEAQPVPPPLPPTTPSQKAAPSAAAVPATPAVAPAVAPIPTAPAVSPVAVPAAAPPTAPDVDLKNLLLTVVAEKTGYPVEILNVDMSLENDLGIDSIKRVEIFSAIKDDSPWLPEVDASEMANIATLGDVLAYIEKFAPEAGEAGPSAEESPAAKDIPAPADDELGRYALRTVAAPHSGFCMKGLNPSTLVAITDDGTGIAPALAERLKGRGMNVQIVNDFLEEATGIILLDGLKDFPDEDSAIAINRQAFLAARIAAKRLNSTEGFFITVQDTGGDFGLSGKAADRVLSGGLPGLIKTAALEWPQASVKAIDLERGDRSADTLAEELAKELFTGGPETEVGLQADGTRIRLESHPKATDPQQPVIDEQSVIIASGGARGVTATTLIELARQLHPRLVLFGRTPLMEEPDCCRGQHTDAELKRTLMEDAKAQGKAIKPAELGSQARQILAAREIQATLKAIEEAGSQVRYMVVDVQDAPAVSAAISMVRNQWGPITGIIHGAGVLNDKLIAEKTPEQFDRVFNTKVQGLRNLLAATSEDPLKVICLFSSVTARFGNIGQCDYAMANEILNKIGNREAHQRGPSCVVKSLNWGPWDGGMVSPALKVNFKEMGIPLIPLDKGAQILVQELQEGGPGKVEVVVGPSPEKGAMAAAGTQKEITLPLIISRAEYPYLVSHCIKDTPVVPVVLALEWFSRAGHLVQPGLIMTSCHDLKVLRGIPLDKFEAQGNPLTLTCCQGANRRNPELTLRLPGQEQNACYSATLQLAEPDQTNEQGIAHPLPEGMEPWPWDLSRIYNDYLFHGPDFQVIRSLESLSNTAATAILAGTKEMGWPGQGWRTDAAALDGGLQLAILWGTHILGRQSLPTKIGAYYSFHEGLTTGRIRCELQGQASGKDRTVSDICFFTEKGKLIAKMCNVEMHMLAG